MAKNGKSRISSLATTNDTNNDDDDDNGDKSKSHKSKIVSATVEGRVVNAL